ncbi:helix-turn-helix domain-containing protein [Shewanella sp. MBTL60-007]|uniref:AraC family transcriptional regulator n=1 Tax=Shewanella sp. MBTL60-007 TaxID=2815911 RepID=UPI001BB910E1|nr:helix-turn-helix transcriptional regulator [Shewanella sp. MBTL60-007]GIU31101.1 AraC family transcriptional regulator [Shewanella sp. MBTL60-007]
MKFNAPSLPEFDSDTYPQAVVALRLIGEKEDAETPFHQHHKCQLVLALSGFVKCHIDDAIWIVPPDCAVWIPSQVPHSNQISKSADVCMLFVNPDIEGMPDKSCTLSMTPLLRELIIHLTAQEQDYRKGGSTDRLVTVLIEQLRSMPTEHYEFPIPSEPRLKVIAKALMAAPDDRQTVAQWASQHAMSERTLSRLVKSEIGLTFGRWRGQLHIVLALQKLAVGESVQRIAEELGYESVSAFITFFKKTLGQSPKQYIKSKAL